MADKRYFLRLITDVYVDALDEEEAQDVAFDQVQWAFDEVDAIEVRYCEEVNEEE